jgi:alpha-1,3-glucan synthase
MLDKHYGTVRLWQDAINEIHARNMSVVLDNTMATYVNRVPHPSKKEV